MTPAECMTILGLERSASTADVKHAYRRLAQQCHPDKHGGREEARRRFIDLSTAYHLLTKTANATRAGRRVGSCQMCRDFGEVVHSLDGLVRCPRCALACRERYLPLPIFVAARCTIPILLLTLATYLLLAALDRSAPLTAAAALVAALLGMISLAAICIRTVHCLPAAPNRIHTNTRVNRRPRAGGLPRLRRRRIDSTK